MKKALSLILALAMVFTLAACGGSADTGVPSEEPSAEPPESAAPEASALTDGYFTYGYAVEGMGDMVRYLHFYEDIGLGGICFYASSGGGGTQSVIGFYTVEDKPFDYSCWATREERNSEGTGQTAGTAPQTITITGINGDALGSVGYDGEYIYVGDENVSSFVIADAMVEDVEKALFLALTGPVTQTEYNMEAAYTMNLYEDGSCELVADMAGNAVAVDTGSYVTDASYDLVFTMGLLGELTAKGDFADPANPVYSLDIPAVEAFSLGEATIGYGQAEE